MTLRLLFAGGTTGKRFTVNVPARATGMRAQMYAFPAESYPFERSFPHRLAGVKKLVDKMQRNDQSAISFFAYGDRHSVRSNALTPRQGTVIEGRTAVKVKIS